MCYHCEKGITHQCRVTGAFEPSRFGIISGPIPQPVEMRTAPYLTTVRAFARQPANADGPRRTDDMNQRDYVHRDRPPAEESYGITPGFHIIGPLEQSSG